MTTGPIIIAREDQPHVCHLCHGSILRGERFTVTVWQDGFDYAHVTCPRAAEGAQLARRLMADLRAEVERS
jgi:hypothetical protein